MSETKSLEELKHIVKKLTTQEVKIMVKEDTSLSGQVSFKMPKQSLINVKDVSTLMSRRPCLLWGKDPNNGWTCIKWGDI